MTEFKEGDVIADSLNWEWVFIMHDGKLNLYPMEFYNDGKLSEKKGACSFFHDPSTWDLTTVRFVRNINYSDNRGVYKGGPPNYNSNVNPTIKLEESDSKIDFNGIIETSSEEN